MPTTLRELPTTRRRRAWSADELDEWLLRRLPWIRSWTDRLTGTDRCTAEDRAELLHEVCVALLERNDRSLPESDLDLQRVIERVVQARVQRAPSLLGPLSLDQLAPQPAQGPTEPLSLLCEAERRAALAIAIERLPSRQRTVVLNDLDGRFCTATTAETLGCTPNAVRVLRARGHRRLRSLLPLLDR